MEGPHDPSSEQPLDPSSVERILRRAHEMTDIEHPEHSLAIDADTLVAAAQEVGIPEDAVRRAIAVERLGPVAPDPASARLAGPAVVAELRFVDASPDEVLDRLDRWLTTGHHLRLERRWSDRAEWTRRHDAGAAIGRRIRRLGGEGRLGGEPRVIAEVSEVRSDGPRTTTAVRLTVDRSTSRRARLRTGAVVSGTGVAGSIAALTFLAPPLLVVSVPTAVVGGWVAASGRSGAERTLAELQRLADAVEDDVAPPSIVGGVRRLFTGGGAPQRTQRRYEIGRGS